MKTQINEQSDSDAKHQQLKVIKIALFGCVAMMINSLIVGLMVDSITLILDASITAVVTFATTLMYVTTKKVHLPPDDFYNFGYSKFEPFTITVHGGLIIASCIISAAYAIMNIMHVEDVSEYVLPTFTVFGSFLFSGLLALYLRKKAKHTNSGLLRSISVQWTNDTFFYAGIFSGFLGGWILIKHGYSNITPFIDPGMTLILVIILIKMPLKVVMENAFELLDAVPGIPTRAKIKKIINHHYPKDFTLQRIRSRKSGHKIFIDICFGVPGGMSLLEIEMLSERIEFMLQKHFLHCDVTVSFKAKKD